MDSEHHSDDAEASSLPTDAEKAPLPDPAIAAVAPSTNSTEDISAPESAGDAVVAKKELMMNGPNPILERTNSAPPAIEEPEVKILPQESKDEAKFRFMPQKQETTTSMPIVDPSDPKELSTLSETEFEEFINSPRGQNNIVERSPGGRYVRFMEKLGSGASKDVYRAYDTTEGIEVAWNVVNLAGVPKGERNRIVNEVRLLERLHHRNIISFHGSWVNRERQEVNFITEILSSGTLKSFIDKVQVIRWKVAKRWATQILHGLAYLHAQDPPVIHRDLKCDNIFINGTSGDLRIGDLGLSTVHRNGKVLSVLGTPEFMAPDLYEEAAYDEKVDIYAFGMCLLEIFTKDIPYRECINPAQIYRKVMQGGAPDSLARIRSKEARDFITLCMGYKDKETGKYTRPSAEELLKHPFLAKGAEDDSEVEVDPPLQERTIREEGSGEIEPKGVTKTMHVPAPPQSRPPEAGADSPSEGTPPTAQSPVAPSRDGVPPRPKQKYRDSIDDDSDRFEEMPDNELNNVGKVKVMMGRGQELEEEEETESEQPTRSNVPRDSSTGEQSPEVQQPSGQGQPTASSSNAKPEVDGTGSTQGAATAQGQAPYLQQPQVPQRHFLVSAAVIEDESPLVRPYQDDILKLIIRLPVEGETQNVQFDFHLVEDDPVQVAKEMVAELSIPQEAVLEVSETISALARSARMKQDKHSNRQNWQQEQMMAQQNVQGQGLQQQGQGLQQQQAGMVRPQHQAHDEQQMHGVVQQQAQHMNQQQQEQIMAQQNVQGQGLQQQQAGMVRPQHQAHDEQQMQGVVQQQQPQHMNQQQQSQHMNQQQQQQQPQQHMNQVMRVNDYPAGSTSGTEAYSANRPQMTHAGAGGPQHVQMHPPQAPMQTRDGNPLGHPELMHARSSSSGQQQQQQPPPPLPQTIYPQGVSVPTSHEDQPLRPVHLPRAPQNQQQTQMQTPAAQTMSHDGSVVGQAHTQHVPYAAPPPAPPPSNTWQQQAMDQAASQPPSAFPAQSQPVAVVARSTSAEEAVPHHDLPRDVKREPQVRLHENGSHPTAELPGGPSRSAPVGEPLVSSGASVPSDAASDEEETSSLNEEIRRLDEDFKKSMLRAQKVFDSRMDNLQRSKEEREAQHQKTLEKHEKERAEFEKRLQQAEKEQNRRIQQLQKEWDKKRESLAKHNVTKKKQGPTEVPGTAPEEALVTEVARAELTRSSTSSATCSENGALSTTGMSESEESCSNSSHHSRSSSNGHGGTGV